MPANPESHERVPAGVQALYPVPPLSWLAPLWAYACGVTASSASSWTSRSLLLFLLGLLLVDPLLGTARRASGQIRFYRELAEDPPRNAAQKPIASIPYTLPGSASSQLASRLGVVSARLQRVAPELGTPLLQLTVSAVFSLAVAAELGQRTLVLATTALLCVYARSLVRERWAASPMMDISLPILLTWLIGHAAYAAIRPGSALVAACFALALCGCSKAHQTGKGLLCLLLPQVVAVIYFIVVRQPVTAAGVTLLASSQLLWAPLLQIPAGRTKYFRAVQLPLATSMLLAAWALGYGP